MTAPYVTALPVLNPLPTTNLALGGKGDAVDITLATVIITGFFFGMLVMLHHIRLLDLDSRLKFAWFFHPTKYRGEHKRLDDKVYTVARVDDHDEEDALDDFDDKKGSFHESFHDEGAYHDEDMDVDNSKGAAKQHKPKSIVELSGSISRSSREAEKEALVNMSDH